MSGKKILFRITKEHPILTVLKQMFLDEIKQSNGIKPQKLTFFMIFCKFLSHKGTFCWKVPLKNIYTFYLKHQKYPFCAPIFHPLSETESYPLYIVVCLLTNSWTALKFLAFVPFATFWRFAKETL